MSGTAILRTLGKAALRLLALAAAAVVLVGQGARFEPVLDPVNAFLAPLLPVLALLLAMALRWRDRVAAGIATLGLLVASFQLGGSALAGIGRNSDAQRSGGTEVRILTLSTWHSNPTPEAIRRVVDTHRPDIAFLQETNHTTARTVDGLLPGYFRLKPCKWRHCSMTILSRWPLHRIKTPARGHEARPDMLVAQVDAPFGTFRIINVHLPRPNDPKALTFLDQFAQVARQNAAEPLIVAGDFNVATGSFGVARFAHVARLRRIDGFTPTYPAHMAIPAFIGIDHVFINRAWAPAGCRRTEPGGSDHHGIACRLRFRP